MGTAKVIKQHSTHNRSLVVKRTVSIGSTVVAAEGQVSSDLGDEVAILDLRGGMYYGLESVGRRIWSLIQEPRTVREIRDIVASEYEVEPERCERDVIELIQRLTDEGLVEVKGGISP
jgi:Coenzyme PQQ synthesis protein D (PqqD)